MSTEGIQGHETTPNGIFEKHRLLFREFLPDWSPLGEYNLVATSSTQLELR
jgi:hypothetical protein